MFADALEKIATSGACLCTFVSALGVMGCTHACIWARVQRGSVRTMGITSGYTDSSRAAFVSAPVHTNLQARGWPQAHTQHAFCWQQ